MRKSRNSHTDKDLLGRFNRSTYEALTREYPFFIGGVIRFFQFSVRAGAFTMRVFLRKNMGKRSFGIWSIVFGYLWIRYFLTKSPNLRSIKAKDLVFGKMDFSVMGNNYNSDALFDFSDTILLPLVNLIYYILQIISNIVQTFDIALDNSIPDGASSSVFYYSYIFIIFSLIHLSKANKKALRWEKADTYARGESIFFDWLRGRKLFGYKLNKDFVRIFVEPIFLLMCSIIVGFSYGDGNGFSLFLWLSGFALMAEEYQDYLFRQEQVLDMIDSEFDGKRLELALDKFNSKELSKDENFELDYVATIAYVMNKEKLKEYNLKNKEDIDERNTVVLADRKNYW